MNIKIFDNAEQIAEAVGEFIIKELNTKPDSVIGFATGASRTDLQLPQKGVRRGQGQL